MTTIAYKAGELAVDSAVFLNNAYVGAAKKSSISSRTGALIATCGDLGSRAKFVRWYEDGEKADSKPGGMDDFSSIVVMADLSAVLTFDTHLERMEVDAPFHADGSGGFLALAAMYAGASPSAAVQIACQLDAYSKEPLVIWRSDGQCWRLITPEDKTR